MIPPDHFPCSRYGLAVQNLVWRIETLWKPDVASLHLITTDVSGHDCCSLFFVAFVIFSNKWYFMIPKRVAWLCVVIWIINFISYKWFSTVLKQVFDLRKIILILQRKWSRFRMAEWFVQRHCIDVAELTCDWNYSHYTIWWLSVYSWFSW